MKQLPGSFFPFFNNEAGYDARDKVEETLNKINDDNQKVQFLRAKVINLLIQKVSAVFIDNEAALLEGTLQKSLIDLLPEHNLQLIKKIDDYSVAHIYNHRSVVEIEIAGYNVIGSLLKAFIDALVNPSSSRSKKLLQIIPKQFVINHQSGSLYSDIQSVVDFIAGMTDLYAMDMYRKITGIDLPLIG